MTSVGGSNKRRQQLPTSMSATTLKAKLRTVAGGTTPREVIATFKTLQMVDVHLPTTDGRELTLSRYTQPEAEHRILLDQLRLSLPSQPPPKITATQSTHATAEPAR